MQVDTGRYRYKGPAKGYFRPDLPGKSQVRPAPRLLPALLFQELIRSLDTSAIQVSR